jgi:hypothetical protein
MFPAERFRYIEALIPLLERTPHWDELYQIEWYVDKCARAGFATTADQIRLCASRFIAGKRKVTPPGTARRKQAEKRRLQMLANVPPELTAAIEAVIAEQQKAVDQFKSGVEKALNSLVGGVMKRYKSDPATVRELLIQRIKQ